jgi:hypothetical protein
MGIGFSGQEKANPNKARYDPIPITELKTF